MIGKICSILMPYYDAATNQMRIKARPALVIGMADSSDMTVLPVSSVTDKRRLHKIYDVKVDPAQYPLANLTKVSYGRTHKVYTANQKEIGSVYCGLKTAYPDLYLDIVCLFEAYAKQLMEQI